jgi:SAM-dependent methyltransferase
VDSSAGAIDRARERWRKPEGVLEFAVADAHALPFGDCEFGGCRADRTIQHVADPEEALAEMVRVTRPGGRVVVSEAVMPLELDDEPLGGRTRELVARFFSSDDTGGFLGYLPPLFVSSGLTQVGLARQESRVSDFGLVRQLLQLDRVAAEAVAAGELTAGERDRWLPELEDAARRGRFAIVWTALHLYGTRA